MLSLSSKKRAYLKPILLAKLQNMCLPLDQLVVAFQNTLKHECVRACVCVRVCVDKAGVVATDFILVY